MTAPRTRFDAIIIGSGINSLVCAALLAKRGKSVCVLERETVAGGCIRSEELTLPGFVHDTLSTLYPLFVTAPHFPVLSSDLEAAGARFVNIATPTAVVLPDGRSLRFSRDRHANIAAFDALAPGDGMAYSRAMEAIETSAALTFGLLGAELWRFKTLRLLLREWRRLGARGLLEFFGRALGSCRDWLEADFQSDLCRALFAPWILHVGLAPEASLSGHMGRLILFTLEQAGSPMVQGGSARLVEAFTKIIELHGGEIRTGTAVARVVTRRGRACGVVTEGGSRLDGRSVVANVGPRQLYRELLEGEALPKRVVADADGFRYGRGEMQIHLALNAVPQWPDPALTQVGMLHLTAGLAGVSRAVNEAERGLLPVDATIVVAQPVAIDPSRAPAGSWIFWIQLQELPRDGQLRGDARGEIATDADGRWTERIRDAYADRIVGRLCALIPNLRASIVGRRVISPADLAAMNVNLVGGDPYGGSCALDQFMMWRPFGAVRNHATPIAGLFHIGASTHPGPGLGGLSGYMAAAAIR